MFREKKTAFRVLLAITMATPALALGAVHPTVLALYLVPSALLFLLLIGSSSFGPARLDLPGALLLGLAICVAIQLVPLPAPLVAWIAPAVHDVRLRALNPLDAPPPSFMPLTLDVTLTAQELGKLILYLAVYWSCLAWTRRHGSQLVLRLVVGAGVAAAAVFLTHKLLLLDKVYGFYVPIQVGHALGPLINPNHLCGLFGLAAATVFGQALATRERSSRILLIGLSALLGGSVLLSMSRGGIAAFIAGQCLFILLRILHRVTRSRGEHVPLALTWLPLGLAFSLAVGLFTAQDAIIGQFVFGDASKLEFIWKQVPLIGRFWTTGVGRGAFWVGFPLVEEPSSLMTFTHAENAPFQILSDLGVPVGGAALLLSLAIVGKMLIRPPARVEHSAALAALVAFGLHNLLDFNSEIPGVAVLAVGLLAALSGRESVSGGSKLRAVPTPVVAVCAVAAMAAAAFIGLYIPSRTIDREERDYSRALAQREAGAFEPGTLRSVLARHPADWYIPFAAGVWRFHTGTGNPVPWLARAGQLNPGSAKVHYYIGRALLRANHFDQAMLEFRVASRAAPGFAGLAAGLLVAREPTFAGLSDFAVTRDDKLLLWPALASSLSANGYQAEAEKADLAILQINPREPRSLARHAKRLEARGETDKALELAALLARRPDYVVAGAVLQAGILKGHGRTTEAVAVLEKALVKTPLDYQLLATLARARQAAGNYEGALQAVSLLRGQTADTGQRIRIALLEAELAVSEKRYQEALTRLREVHALDPNNIQVLRRILGLAERVGDRQRAAEALRKLESLAPDDAAVKQRAERLRASGFRDAVPRN